MLGRDLLGEGDHFGDVIGGDRPARGLADVEIGEVGLERGGVMRGDVPDRLGRGAGGGFHLVVAGVGVGGQMADIGDVDDMGERIALPGQRAAQRVGEDIGAQVADVGVIVDRRAARINADAPGGVERREAFEAAG